MGAAAILLAALCIHLIIDSLRLGHPILSI